MLMYLLVINLYDCMLFINYNFTELRVELNLPIRIDLGKKCFFIWILYKQFIYLDMINEKYKV